LLIALLMVGLSHASARAQDPPPAPPITTGTTESTEATQDQPGFMQKARRWAERTQIAERLSGEIDGWYPRLGGMTRGSGFSIGPGYRFHVGDVRVDLSAGYSIKNYKAVDAKVRWLSVYDDRLELWTNYRFEDFPQEDYFGMGPDSAREARTSYDFDSNDFSVKGLFKATPWLAIGTTLGYMSPGIGQGSDDSFPSIEEQFTDAQAPGLAAQPNFLHTTFFVDIDYRDAPGNPRSGGFYHAGFGIWNDRTLEQYDFRRFDLDLLQFVPLVPARTHVLVGHFGVSFVNNEIGHRVPFYFLPYVGGVDTVRSFHEFRFKDENAVWLSAEYRWVPIKYVSFATFIDAGKVAADYQDINASDLKKGYGFGVRVHTRTQTFARIDFATGGGEGWKVFLKLGPRL
jgi:outer membrane protein assembly factor BamA